MIGLCTKTNTNTCQKQTKTFFCQQIFTNIAQIFFLTIYCCYNQYTAKNRYAVLIQRSGCRGAETMVIGLCSFIFPDKSGCKP